MSKSSSDTNPQILVNGEQRQEQQQEQQKEQQQEQQTEQHKEQQQEQKQGTDDAAGEDHISSGGPDNGCSEDNAAPEKEMQVKLQSVIQQVRGQIRSQGGTRASKSSILELVQRVKDREVEGAQMGSEPEGGDVNSEENRPSEMNLKEQELCAMFEQKLEASKKAWRDEYELQISQVCREMQAYTDKALKDLECRMQSWQPPTVQQTPPREQQESKGPDRKQKPPAAAPSLAARRGRVLTRTMTTIIPKTCTPVIMGPRAKSESLSYSRGVRSRLLPRDLTFSSPGNKSHQSHKPLPPTQPQPHHQFRQPVWGKNKA